MKSREELAEALFLRYAGTEWAVNEPSTNSLVKQAFAEADAFLAACGEQPAQEREPDAVWTVEALPHGFQVRYADGTGMLVMPNDMACTYDQLSSLIAGRDRVRLEVRVVED